MKEERLSDRISIVEYPQYVIYHINLDYCELEGVQQMAKELKDHILSHHKPFGTLFNIAKVAVTPAIRNEGKKLAEFGENEVGERRIGPAIYGLDMFKQTLINLITSKAKFVRNKEEGLRYFEKRALEFLTNAS